MNKIVRNSIARRLGGRIYGNNKNPYKFTKIKNAKAEAKKAHPEIGIIDMGVGEPDYPADAAVVETLANEAGKSENRWYADNGIEEFQIAAAEHVKHAFGIERINKNNRILSRLTLS